MHGNNNTGTVLIHYECVRVGDLQVTLTLDLTLSLSYTLNSNRNTRDKLIYFGPSLTRINISMHKYTIEEVLQACFVYSLPFLCSFSCNTKCNCYCYTLKGGGEEGANHMAQNNTLYDRGADQISCIYRVLGWIHEFDCNHQNK
jgi:hypothetical protein